MNGTRGQVPCPIFDNYHKWAGGTRGQVPCLIYIFDHYHKWAAWDKEPVPVSHGVCLLSYLYEKEDTMITDRVVYISRWETKEDFQATVGGAVFNKHIPAMAPYYVSGTDSFLESI